MTAPPTDRLSAVVDTATGGTRVVFAGRLDVHAAHIAREVLQSVQKRAARVSLDLTHVQSIDAAGLGVLVAGMRRADTNGGSLTVSSASGVVLQALHVMGLAAVLDSGSSGH